MRVTIPVAPNLIESQCQPNPGWGRICLACQHEYPEDKKEDCDCPCRKAYCGPVGDMKWPSLVRYTDGSESCDRFEKKA